MAVPRHSHTRSKTGKHRMHIFIKPAALAACQKCGKSVLPHTVCKACGFYKGKEVVNVMASLTKKDRKAKEQEMKAQEKETKQESIKDLSQKV